MQGSEPAQNPPSNPQLAFCDLVDCLLMSTAGQLFLQRNSPIFNSLYWAECGLAWHLQTLGFMQQGMLAQKVRTGLELVLQPRKSGRGQEADPYQTCSINLVTPPYRIWQPRQLSLALQAVHILADFISLTGCFCGYFAHYHDKRAILRPLLHQ